MAYLIGLLLSAIVFGCITKYIADSKGYDGGFWWGFWLGFIGILVVGFRPDNRNQYRTYSPSELPAWASSASPSVSSSANTSGWTCICGAKNPSSVEYCLSCRRSKSEGDIPKKICPHCGAGNKATNRLCFACDKPLYGSIQKKDNASSKDNNPQKDKEYLILLEQLAKLHEQGILTDEEFQQKKTEILSRILVQSSNSGTIEEQSVTLDSSSTVEISSEKTEESEKPLHHFEPAVDDEGNWICTYCGAKNIPDVSFCLNCMNDR